MTLKDGRLRFPLTIFLFGALLVGIAPACADDAVNSPLSKSRNKKTSKPKAEAGSTDGEAALITKLNDKFEECVGDGKVWLPEMSLQLSTLDDDDAPTKASGSSGSSGSSGTASTASASGSAGADSEASTVLIISGTGGSCGAPLVGWCCTADEVKARFPGAPEALDGKLRPNLEAGYQIYACSQEDKDNVKVHMIKREGGKTQYVNVAIRGLVETPAEPASGSGSAPACKVDFKALLGAGAAGAGSASGSASADAFAAVNQVLKDNCNGGGCHGPTAKSYPVYVDNAVNVKDQAAVIAKRIQDDADPMPIGGLMGKADQKVILDFLKKK